MDTILIALAITGGVTVFVLGLLWFVQRLFGVLPEWLNSSKLNARLLLVMVGVGFLAFWLSSLDQMLESDRWSVVFCKNLAWVIVLPSLFIVALSRLFSASAVTPRLTVSARASHPTRELDSATESSILDALQRGAKIEAIRLYRERFGVSLKEAKDFIEAMDMPDAGS